jgi:hypothetical protein
VLHVCLLTALSANETCRLPLRIPGSRERSPVDGRVGERRAPDWEGCSFDGEEKEERTVIERYKGGGGGDRSVDSNVERSACC